MSKQYEGSINIGVSFQVNASSEEKAHELIRKWLEKISGIDFSVSYAEVTEIVCRKGVKV